MYNLIISLRIHITYIPYIIPYITYQSLLKTTFQRHVPI